MRRPWMPVAVLFLVAPLVAGCAQKKTDSASTEAPPAAGESAGMEQGRMEAAPPAVQAAPPAGMELTRMTLEGKIGCGHCTYHVTESCALAMQAGDGTVYVIASAPSPDYDQFFGDRFSGKQITVTGDVGELDGKWMIYAEQIELN